MFSSTPSLNTSQANLPHATALKKAINSFLRMEGAILNDVVHHALIDAGENAQAVARGLRLWFRSSPSLINDTHCKILVVTGIDADTVAAAMLSLYHVSPELLNTGNLTLLVNAGIDAEEAAENIIQDYINTHRSDVYKKLTTLIQVPSETKHEFSEAYANANEQERNDALFEAIACENVDAFVTLITLLVKSYFVDLNKIMNRYKRTPLMEVCAAAMDFEKQKSMIMALFQLATESNTAQDFNLSLLLTMAIRARNFPLVCFLLDLKAQCQDQNDASLPLAVAAELGDVATLRKLRERGAKTTSFGYGNSFHAAFKHKKENPYLEAHDGKIQDLELFFILCSTSMGYSSDVIEREAHERAINLAKTLLQQNNIVVTIGSDLDTRKDKRSEGDDLFSEGIQSQFFPEFNKADIWRLFVDGVKQKLEEENGWCAYEKREAGCLEKMSEALQYACAQPGSLSTDIAGNIHRIATEHFYKTRNHFCLSTHGYYYLTLGNTTIKGYLELLEDKKITLSWTTTRLEASYCGNPEVGLETLIQQYHLAQAQPETGKKQTLENIIFLASKYARMHPKADGNNRTAMVILNRELIKYGFLPAIMENPNRLEGFAQDELYEEVLQGMRNFIYVARHHCYFDGKTTAACKESAADDMKNVPDAVGFTLKNLLADVAIPKPNQYAFFPAANSCESNKLKAETGASLNINSY